jgi:hypothetical protein
LSSSFGRSKSLTAYLSGVPERIVPDGLVEAVFHYRTPFDMRYGDTRFSRQAASIVVSQKRPAIGPSFAAAAVQRS